MSKKKILPKTQKKNSNNNLIKKEKRKKHDKTENGNIREKIKTNYHKFIIDFLNEKIREKFRGKQIAKFRKISPKKNSKNKIFNKNLLLISIKDFVKNKISKKFQYKPEDQNIKTLEKINPLLDNYLEMSYEDFYTNYFLKENTNTNNNNLNSTNNTNKKSKKSKKSKKIDYFNDFLNKIKLKEIEEIELNIFNEEEKNKKYKELENYLNKIKFIAYNYIKYYKT
jgi:hypothetical protein